MFQQRVAPSDPPLALRLERLDEETACLSVEGELELFTADAFQAEAERAARATARRLVLDLSKVRFVDSAGISALLGVAKRLRGFCTVALVAPETHCRAALDLVQLPRLIPTYDTLEDALEAVGG